ncbi:CRISPR-associated RAMP protein [Leptolyngbya sp. 7M]|nr:CRISPR-associated RAMP protein [Leptolyngbya sp. 7M]
MKSFPELVGGSERLDTLLMQATEGRIISKVGAESSFKGAMRSRLESFLRGIDVKLAANPAVEAEWSITNERLNGRNGIKEEVEQELKRLYPKDEQASQRVGKKDELLTQAILAETDLVSRLFGSPWLSSKFQIRDLTVLPDAWFGQYQERDGVAIDRDTETAADGKLYDFQVVPAGTPFQFHAIVENAENWELGLLMIGLHQFETEQIPLGGGRSRGLGVVKLENLEMKWFDARSTTDPKKTALQKTDPEKLMSYLSKLVNDDSSAYEDASKYRKQWVEQFINHLQTLIESSHQEENRRSATQNT